MFKDHKYSVVYKNLCGMIFFRFLTLSASTVRVSEGTICRVEAYMCLCGGFGVLNRLYETCRGESIISELFT